MDAFIDTCPGSIQGASGALFINLINTLMAAQCSLSTANQYPQSYSPFLKNNEEFDYIVVGAGSAGSVVASRLSENEKMRVLLIEAGGIPTPTTEMPLLLYNLQNTAEDWNYKTEPSDSSCLGFKGNQCVWPRGKVIGGSSAINAATYIRGSRGDYDAWGKNNPGWNYNTVLQYFKKIENTIPDHLKSTNLYGINGPITINQTISKHPLRQVIIDAAKELGHEYYPQEVPLGYFDALNNIENGLRVSSSKGYLSKMKISERNNLFIAMNAQVGKLLFDGNKNNVIGVQVQIKMLNSGIDKIINLRTRKEVILSAGAINSPQILMNSGIGPKNHLKSLNIKLRQDLNVGGNLQDHYLFSGFLLTIEDKLVHKYDTIDELYKFYKNQDGFFASTDLNNFIGMVKLDKNNKNTLADFEILHGITAKGDLNNYRLFAEKRGFKQSYIDSEIEIIKNNNLHRVMFSVTQPKSRGRILLQSNNSYDYPKLYSNYLNDENNEDLKKMMDGIAYLKRLYTSTNAFKNYNVTLIRPFVENCVNLTSDDDYYACSLRNVGSTLYHVSGTCKMGPKRDKEAVVDNKLRVHGIKNLRVIDASIMPTIITVNTNAATMMIGERGADFIKETWA